MTQHIMITGAASGIGRSLALQAGQRENTAMSLVDVDTSGLGETAGRVKSTVYTHTHDLADIESLPALLNEVTEKAGPVDTLINCAGIMFIRSMAGTKWEDALGLMALDLLAPLRLIDLALPGMIKAGGGHIVNVSSMAGITSIRGCTYYGASKAGLAHASEILRGEVKRHGVRVLTVYPGPVRTPLEEQCRSEVRASLVSDLLPTGKADIMARRILQGMERNSARVVYSRFYHLARRFRHLASWFSMTLGPDPNV